jgi:hypothetical protein
VASEILRHPELAPRVGVKRELLISGTTRATAGSALLAREVDRVRVVGRGQPLALFEPVVEGAPDARQRALLDRDAGALAAYRARDFAAAAGGFAGCLALAPDDGPSAVLLERARAFAQHPRRSTGTPSTPSRRNSRPLPPFDAFRHEGDVPFPSLARPAGRRMHPCASPSPSPRCSRLPPPSPSPPPSRPPRPWWVCSPSRRAKSRTA